MTFLAKKSRVSLAMLAFSALSTLPQLATAADNQVYLTGFDQGSGNNFGTNLPLVSGIGSSDTIVGIATEGTGNKAAVLDNVTPGTIAGNNTNFMVNGSNNALVTSFVNATNSTSQVYQGNSLAQSAINLQPHNVANLNYAQTTETGNAENSLVVQKGNSNVAFATINGNNSSVTEIQEMRDTPNDVIPNAPTDPNPTGTHKGGNDVTATVNGDGDKVTTNQYNASIAHLNINGNGVTDNIHQVTAIFDVNRKYPNTVNTNQTNVTGGGVTVDQNAAGALVNVTQNNGTNLTANVTQTQGGNIANINQTTGANDAVTASQIGVNKLTAAQTGTGNTVTDTQELASYNPLLPQPSVNPIGSTAAVTQTGDNNSAAIDAHGYNDAITLTQSSTAGSAGNKATLSQNFGSNYTATISQTGTNTVDGAQWGASLGSTAAITQVGNNSLTFKQGEQGVIQDSNQDTVGPEEWGQAYGTIVAKQTGTNTADIRHSGYYNSVTLTQDSTGSTNGGNSFTSHQFTGDHRTSGNTITASQQGSNTGSVNQYLFDNTTNLTQVGNGNVASSDQQGLGYTANISQNGSGNQLEAHQYGSSLGYTASVVVSQQGTNNKGLIIQGVPGSAALGAGENTLASITQVGNDNYAKIYQAGYDTHGTITEYGNSNSADIEMNSFNPGHNGNVDTQISIDIGTTNAASSGNVAFASAIGPNASTTTINGNNNNTTIIQNNGGFGAIEIAHIAVNGDNNTSSIQQAGTGHYAAVTQNGNGLQFSLTQFGGSGKNFVVTQSSATPVINITQ